MEAPSAERETFQKRMNTGSAEPDAKQSETVATPDRSLQQEEEKSQHESVKSALTITLLEDQGKHTKYQGVLPIYEVTALVRNSSPRALKWLKMTVIYRDAQGSLISTQNQYAESRTIEPGATSTVKVMTRENLDTIDHYDLQFDADGEHVECRTTKSR
jgi:hypothetical protein